MASILHLDGCHFFVWVYDNGGDRQEWWLVQYDERTGDNLAIHSMPDCSRCRELRRGAPVESHTLHMRAQRDPRKVFGALLEVLIEQVPTLSEPDDQEVST